MNHIAGWLRRLCACREGLQWATEVAPSSLQEAWDLCPDGEWMTWLVYVVAYSSNEDIEPFDAATREAREWRDEQQRTECGVSPLRASVLREYADRIRLVVPVCPVPEPTQRSDEVT